MSFVIAVLLHYWYLNKYFNTIMILLLPWYRFFLIIAAFNYQVQFKNGGKNGGKKALAAMAQLLHTLSDGEQVTLWYMTLLYAMIATILTVYADAWRYETWRYDALWYMTIWYAIMRYDTRRYCTLWYMTLVYLPSA